MLRMDQNALRQLLFIKVTEIVEVTETITILIENDVMDTEQDSEDASPTVDIFTDQPISSWIQLEMNELLLNAAPLINIEEQTSSRRIQ